MDEDDDIPQLSATTLEALQQFLNEQTTMPNIISNPSEENSNPTEIFEKDFSSLFPEDWQMSQFWYDDETSNLLASEVSRVTGSNDKAVCVSCPSVYKACKGAKNVHLLEFDKRFKAFGSSFFFYDYTEPENIPDECKHAYSVIIADPPFLSLECLTKLSITIHLLAAENAKIILCTGAIMSAEAQNLLPVKRSSFIPKHRNNLGNEFACFTNYDLLLTNV